MPVALGLQFSSYGLHYQFRFDGSPKIVIDELVSYHSILSCAEFSEAVYFGQGLQLAQRASLIGRL